LNRYGVGVCPVLAFNNQGNRNLTYLVLARKLDSFEPFKRALGLRLLVPCRYKAHRKYYYMHVKGIDALKLTDIILSKGTQRMLSGGREWGLR
jgi:hypothetical protein